MLTDRYGLPLSTASAAAQDAYVEASDLALTFYPGAAEAYDRAIVADPAFALAYAGKAQVLMRQGDVAAARLALAAAKETAKRLSEREASHLGFFDLVFAGRTEAAIAALYAHLAAWPRDALVVSVAVNPNGLIGASGRIGQKHQIAELMDGLLRITARISGSPRITRWRCPRTGSSRRPAQRSSAPSLRTRTMRTPRTVSPMSATRAATSPQLAPFSPRGSPAIPATAFSMAT
jgi:hypothetical protein